jgi:IS30 family transposase
MDNNQNNHIQRQYDIDERRRKIAALLAQSFTETEIAQQLGIYQSMVARDVKALREMSQQFIHDLAKSDLAYYYKSCIDGVEQAMRKAWEMFNNFEWSINNEYYSLRNEGKQN